MIAWIIGGETPGNLLPHIDEVRQPVLVELLEHAGLDLPFEKVSRWHDEVVAGVAGEQFGLQHVVRIERVVLHLDAALPGEVLEHRRVDVVRPVVKVDRAVGLRLCAGGNEQQKQQKQRKQQAQHFPSPPLLRRADASHAGARSRFALRVGPTR